MMHFEQRSDEWFRGRLGKVTASRVHTIYIGKKGAESYARELADERLTGERRNTFTSPAMLWGIETEPAACRAYEARTRSSVRGIGFVSHPYIDQAGASPDGLVSSDGLIEIKCPSTNTHLHTLRNRKVPKKYFSQIQWQLACTNRAWVDFVSFDPRLPADKRIYIERVFRDNLFIELLNERVITFLAKVDKLCRSRNSLPVNTSKLQLERPPVAKLVSPKLQHPISPRLASPQSPQKPDQPLFHTAFSPPNRANAIHLAWILVAVCLFNGFARTISYSTTKQGSVSIEQSTTRNATNHSGAAKYFFQPSSEPPFVLGSKIE